MKGTRRSRAHRGPPSSHLRPLALPRQVEVRVDAGGDPVAVQGKRGFVAIEGIRERWRIDDEWWRLPISRAYFEVVLEGGRPLLLFHDLTSDLWYFQ